MNKFATYCKYDHYVKIITTHVKCNQRQSKFEDKNNCRNAKNSRFTAVMTGKTLKYLRVSAENIFQIYKLTKRSLIENELFRCELTNINCFLDFIRTG